MWRAKPRCIALSSPAQTEKGVEWNSFVKPFMPYWKTYIGPWLCHINEVYASTIATAATTLLRSTVSPQAHLLVAQYEHRYSATWFYYRRASVIVHVYFSVGHAQVAARLNLECGADGAAPGRPSRRHRRHTTPLVDPPLQSPFAIDALPLERMNTDRPDPGRDALRY